MIRTALQLLSPAGARGRLSVLIFHRVLPQEDPLFPEEVHAQRFDEICAWLKSWFNVQPLDVAAEQLAAGTLPSRACCITFDDGYADNLEIATPILNRHGLPATFFIATGFLGGGCMWNDMVIESMRGCAADRVELADFGSFDLGSNAARRQAIDALIGQLKYLEPAPRERQCRSIAAQAGVEIPTHLMMAADSVRALRDAGMQIGAHTVDHPILASLQLPQARQQIADSRRFLEDLLGERVGLFAYPNGKPGKDYLPEHVPLVRELGFDAAVSTAWGAAAVGADPFQIPRFTPWDRGRTAFGLRLARQLAQRPS